MFSKIFVSNAKNICCHLETGLAGEVQGEGQQPGRVLAGAGRGVVVEVQLVPLLASSLAIGTARYPHPHLLRIVTNSEPYYYTVLCHDATHRYPGPGAAPEHAALQRHGGQVEAGLHHAPVLGLVPELGTRVLATHIYVCL